jgi:hypothetical protein
MTSKTNSNIALGDVRSTSYNAQSANPYGYQGSIDDAIAQIRTEPDEVRAYWPLNISRERHELLGFLGVHQKHFSGIQLPHADRGLRPLFVTPEDDSVEYGVPEAPVEPGFYTLAYAQKHFPQSFKQ